jgi:hypothetical protein
MKVAERPLKWGDDAPNPAEQVSPSSQPARTSLGSAAAPRDAASSPGMPLYYTYMDDQYRSPGKRMVDFRGKRPDIHFVYSATTDPLEDSRFGYNVYDPITGSWPRGSLVGCIIQAVGESGQHAIMDVNGKGYVAISGVDNAGAPMDNHMYYQPAKQSCNFGSGTTIDKSQYEQFFVTKATSNRLFEPAIEIQEWAGDTITHLLAKEEALTKMPGGVIDNSAVFGLYTITYFRKVGAGTGGTWTGPVCIDTVNNISNGNGTHNGSIAASRVSPKVAVVYIHWKKDSELPWGSTDLRYDNDTWYRVSDSVGLVWGPKINLTKYDRTQASYCSKLNSGALWDHEGFLHIIWDGPLVPANVYDDATFFWGDFSTNIWHWSNRTNQIAKVHNADWGIDVNTQTCGFGSPGGGYASQYTMSECEGRIYIVFSQHLNYLGDDVTPETPRNLDDCASGGWTEKRYAANGELYMVVSKNLDGILWDAARNITRSYTPKCDSAGFGGVCMNDTRSSLSRYGMAANSYDTGTPPVPVVLKWPGTDLVDKTPAGDPPDTGGNFIMMMYTEDHFPAPAYRDRGATATYGRLTYNPLQFVRLACVDPVPAPRIFTDTTRIGYPAFVHHGVADTVTVTVTNEGNAQLNIFAITGVRTTQLSKAWLTTTSLSSVPAGIPNTGTFDITLNAGGVVNNAGTVVDLSGLVYIKSDARPPRDSINIVIDRFLVADTVQQQVWDTVSTSCGVRLMVSNNGDMGRNGYGGVNIDYTALKQDCDSFGNPNSDTYLYDGGPIVVREVLAGVTYSWSNQMYQIGFQTNESFKPYVGGSAGSFTGTGFDGYRTGTFLNRDSLIGVQATYWAPTPSLPGGDSCNFIIVKKQYFSRGASAVNKVTVGEQIDWDIPSDNGSNNTSDILGGYTVYQRGTDTGVVPDCGTQFDSARYGAGMLFGKYSKTEFAADPCINNTAPVGIFSEFQDTMFNYDSLTDANLEGKYFWDRMKNSTGLTATPIKNQDLRTVYTWYANRDFPANDTVTVYTALATVKKGTAADLDKAFHVAFEWYKLHLRPTCPNLTTPFGCCAPGSLDGRTGNVDCDIAKGVDISDLSTLIDFLYISFTPLCCDAAANIDGDPAGGIDISDLSLLIDFLYISFTPTSLCK